MSQAPSPTVTVVAVLGATTLGQGIVYVRDGETTMTQAAYDVLAIYPVRLAVETPAGWRVQETDVRFRQVEVDTYAALVATRQPTDACVVRAYLLSEVYDQIAALLGASGRGSP